MKIGWLYVLLVVGNMVITLYALMALFHFGSAFGIFPR